VTNLLKILKSRLTLLLAAGTVLGTGVMSGGMASAYGEGIDSLSGNYLAGLYARRLKDNDAAAEYFARALRDDPENQVIITRAFELEVSRGNFSRGAKLAKQVVANDPRHRMARTALALQDIKAGKFASAREHLTHAAYTPLGQLTSALLTAWSWAGEKRFENAMAALGKLDKTESFAIYKSFNAALISDFLDKPIEAARYFSRIYDDASSSLRVVQSYGNFLERQGKKDEAVKVYQRYMQGQVSHPLIKQTLARTQTGGNAIPIIRTVQDGAAEALFSLSSALADQSGTTFALIYAQASMVMRPGFPISLTLLGDIYEDMKNHANAIRAYERIPVGSALRPNAEIRIAINLDQMGEDKKAEEKLKAQLERKPDDYDSNLTLANLYRSHENFADAAKYYSRTIELAGDVEPRHWTLFYFRGICFERSNRWPEAEADFRNALKLNNEQPLVLNYLGYSWIDKGLNFDEAIEMIRKAVELRPNDGYIVDSLGWAYYKLKNYSEAVKNLERAVELKPDDPVINDHLGDAYWRSERKLEAGFQWQHAKDNKPEPDDLAEIEKKLKSGMPDDTPDAAAGEKPEPEKKS
jgi:tetratricopeptide (TPR) repeat protein